MSNHLTSLTPVPPEGSDSHIEASIAELQPALRAYVVSLVGGKSGLSDIVQETNILIWKKRSDFEPGTNFKAWAFRIAYFKALGHRRDEARRGRFVFNDELMLTLADEAQAMSRNNSNERLDVLKECVETLPESQQILVGQHYLEGISLSDIAGRSGRKDNAVYKEISRLRQVLRKCVQRKMGSADAKNFLR